MSLTSGIHEVTAVVKPIVPAQQQYMHTSMLDKATACLCLNTFNITLFPPPAKTKHNIICKQILLHRADIFAVPCSVYPQQTHGPDNRPRKQNGFIQLHIVGLDNDGGKPKYGWTRSWLKHGFVILQIFLSSEVWTSTEK